MKSSGKYLVGGFVLLWLIGITVAESPVEFNRDIRPILADNCFHCHGPDKAKRKAELRLDSPESATARQLIVPGKPIDSELYQRITARDAAKRMPPQGSNRSLNDAQIAMIKR